MVARLDGGGVGAAQARGHIGGGRAAEENVRDIVTIEHLYSVKKMVDDLLSMREKFDDKTDDKVVYEYLVNKTHCVYKFYKAEKELHG